MKKILSIVFFVTIPFLAEASDFDLSGDLRYRLETTYQGSGADARQRHRVRARLRGDWQVVPGRKAVLGIATGSTNPISRNATLDGSSIPQAIGLDLAFMETVSNGGKLVGRLGKMKLPFYIPWKSELLWDNDLTPEGLFMQWKTLVNLSTWVFWVEERSSDLDSMLLGADVYKNFELGSFKLTPSVAYFGFTNAAGFGAFGTGFKGNSNNGSTYTADFSLLNTSLGLSSDSGNQPWMAYFEYVTNLNDDAGENNTGWALGASYGKAKAQGDWSLKYIYKYLESDAVVGAFSDSNFRGGGTDGKGHELSFTLGTSAASSMKITAFIDNQSISDETVDSFNRYQVDFSMKF